MAPVVTIQHTYAAICKKDINDGFLRADSMGFHDVKMANCVCMPVHPEGPKQVGSNMYVDLKLPNKACCYIVPDGQ